MSDKPQVTRTQSTFSMSCQVEVRIQAEPSAIWKLLTDAAGFPRWNSTVTSIEGAIREGEKVTIRVPNVDRAFTGGRALPWA